MLATTSLWLPYFLITGIFFISNVINETMCLINLITDGKSDGMRRICTLHATPSCSFLFPISLSLSLSLPPNTTYGHALLCHCQSRLNVVGGHHCVPSFPSTVWSILIGLHFSFGLFLLLHFFTQSCLLLTLFNLIFLLFCLIGSTFRATFGTNWSLEHCFWSIG